MKKIVGILSVLLILISGCSSEKTEEVAKKSEYQVGEIAEIKGLKMSVNSSRLLEGNEYFGPDEGTQWIAYDITFENTSDESKYIGAILEISLKDGEGRSKDYNVFGETDGTLDSNVLAQEKLSGEISFVISGEETELYLYYQPTFSKENAIKFKVK